MAEIRWTNLLKFLWKYWKKGSPEQNSVVIANAGMALFCGDQGVEYH